MTKMEKNVIDRRLNILEAEGVNFKCNIEVGKTILAKEIEKDFDAILLAIGASVKREMPIPKVVKINGPTELGLVIFLLANKRFSSLINFNLLKK